MTSCHDQQADLALIISPVTFLMMFSIFPLRLFLGQTDKLFSLTSIICMFRVTLEIIEMCLKTYGDLKPKNSYRK